MSVLSKVFVILVFIVSLVWTGIIATLFAHRIDWKDKFVKEVNYHYMTQNIKNAEIAAVRLELENVKTYISVLEAKNDQLEIELAAANAKAMEIQRQLDYTKGLLTKLEAAQSVFVRQLQVQLAQIKDYADKVEEFRGKLARAINEKTTAIQELQYARQEAQRLQKDIAELESYHVSLAREHKRLEEIIEELNRMGVRTDVSPKKALTGRVTAVSNDIGLVIISIGKDDDVRAGDEFTVYRNDNFVAKIVIDRVDRRWSAGRVVLKMMDPRVGDSASNHIFVSGYNAEAGR
ncbi:MAG: hypothetical protein ACYTAF_04525 [Planctomycetota bacterium]|jgi:myosin heavy subunit